MNEKAKIMLGVGAPTSNECVIGLSNEVIGILKDVGLYKYSADEGNEDAKRLNALMGANIHNLADEANEWVLRVLERNEFVRVEPTSQTVRAYFEAMASDMEKKEVSERCEGKETFSTVFKPMVKQFGELIVFYTINAGFELVLNYFVGARYADVANEYVNAMFTRNRNGEGLKGVFRFSNDLISNYNDNRAVIADGDNFLKYNLSREEEQYLNRVKNGYGRAMDFNEVLDSNEYLEDTKYILESNNVFGVNEIDITKELRDEIAYIEGLLLDADDFDDIKAMKFAINWITNYLDGYESYTKKDAKTVVLTGDNVERFNKCAHVIGVTGARDIKINDGLEDFKEYLNANDVDAVLCGGAYGFDQTAIRGALDCKTDVYIINPKIKSDKALNVNLRLKSRLNNKGHVYILNMVYESDDVKDQYKERNEAIAQYSELVLYRGLKDASGTASTLYACDRHATPYKRL